MKAAKQLHRADNGRPAKRAKSLDRSCAWARRLASV